MKQPLMFQQNEIENLAGNADALFSWLEQEESATQMKERRAPIPSHLILVAATIVASGLPVLLDPHLPTSTCWYGGCAM